MVKIKQKSKSNVPNNLQPQIPKSLWSPSKLPTKSPNTNNNKNKNNPNRNQHILPNPPPLMQINPNDTNIHKPNKSNNIQKKQSTIDDENDYVFSDSPELMENTRSQPKPHPLTFPIHWQII